MTADSEQQSRQYLLARFWEAALGFWRRGGPRAAWALTVLVLAIALLNLGLQYRLNVWHRAMSDAIDRREGIGVMNQTVIFIPLIAAVVGVAAVATHLKLPLQRRWRAWLNAHVLDQWLTDGRYYQLNLVPRAVAYPCRPTMSTMR
jgi:vitamin B12/bleomycin/antimicrobial peptide transport system ATP-binding/permease protein